MTYTPIHQRLSRRTLLRGAGMGAVGLAGAVLIGCSSDDDEPTATATATATPTEEMMDDHEPMDRMIGEPKNYELVSGWYRDEEARYYDFGMASPLAASGAVGTAPIYAFITGMGSDGNPIFVEGQHNVVDVVPGDEGYSDLWAVMLVTVPADFEADSIHSQEQLDAAGYEITPTPLLVNCPIVPAESTFEGGESLVQGWYRGERVYYPDFGLNPAVAIPIWVFANGTNADGTPAFVEGQRNIIDSIPGEAGYSAFWRVNLVMVDDTYAADSIRSAADVAAGGFEIVTTDLMVNCPVVSPVA